MTISLQDILSKKNFDEPLEIRIIKDFLQTNYKATAQVTVQSNQIIIAVHGASLAGTVRMRLHELKELCHTEKRLVLRITS